MRVKSRTSIFRRNAGPFLVVAIVLAAGILRQGAAATKKHPPAHPIDLNTATIEQLEQLPGVGPTTAKAIVQFREKSGRFRRVEELLAVRGISEGKLKKLRPYITVSPPARKPK